METKMTIDQMLQYKVKNSFNADVFKEVKMTLLSAKADGFTNLLVYWTQCMGKMIMCDTNDVEINKDYIETAKEHRHKMTELIYK